MFCQRGSRNKCRCEIHLHFRNKNTLRLTSTSKFTSSPSRKTTVQTRPFLIGGLPWCLLIEWIFPFEFNKCGRNFGLWWGGEFSSFKAFAWCFAWRRLKKRINRAAAIDYCRSPVELNIQIGITMIIFNRERENESEYTREWCDQRVYETEFNDARNWIDQIYSPSVNHRWIREKERESENNNEAKEKEKEKHNGRVRMKKRKEGRREERETERKDERKKGKTT